MVNTRTDLKLKIKEKIQSLEQPFKTQDIVTYANEVAPNIWSGSNRIAKYIKATDIAEFNKTKKVWSVKTKPQIKGDD
jgi:hypothetical protein